MAKDLSKESESYNLPHIIRDAVVFYGKGGDVIVSKEQVEMLKENYHDKVVPSGVKYKEEVKSAK